MSGGRGVFAVHAGFEWAVFYGYEAEFGKGFFGWECFGMGARADVEVL